MTGPHHHRAVALTVALEAQAGAMLTARGYPADLTRLPTRIEVTSGTSYGAIDEAVNAAAGRLAARSVTARDAAIRAIRDTVAAAHSPAEVLRMLDQFAAGVAIVPGHYTLANGLAETFRGELRALGRAALGQFGDDADRIGITSRGGGLSTMGEVRVLSQTDRLVADVLASALGAVRGAAYRTARGTDTTASFLQTVLDRALGTGVRGLTGVAHTAAVASYAAGRLDGLADLTAPVTVYASELLDRATCDPCANIDGTYFDTFDAAREAYPDGRFVDCLGGDNCRGTLIVVNPGERAATVPTPYTTAADMNEVLSQAEFA